MLQTGQDSILLNIENLKTYFKTLDGTVRAVDGVTFDIKKGEIVGFAGLMGSGRTELALSLFGNPEGYQISGEMFINGQNQHFKHPREAIQAGIERCGALPADLLRT